MDDSLKRLLDAEQRAQRMVDDALEQQEKFLLQARQEANEAEVRFRNAMRELRLSLDTKAEEEAARSIAELERRSEEHRQELQTLAEQYREEASDAAIRILMDADRL